MPKQCTGFREGYTPENQSFTTPLMDRKAVFGFVKCEPHHQSCYQPDTPACLSHHPAHLLPFFCLLLHKGGGEILVRRCTYTYIYIPVQSWTIWIIPLHLNCALTSPYPMKWHWQTCMSFFLFSCVCVCMCEVEQTLATYHLKTSIIQ